MNPYLNGNFAPVHDELDVRDLPVDGALPPGLDGGYLKNGPNPAFPPIWYTYPPDGDGIIHAVYLEGGRTSWPTSTGPPSARCRSISPSR